jgi:hypothetical protein
MGGVHSKDVLLQIKNLVGNVWQPPLAILATVYTTEIVQSSYERPAEVLLPKQLDDTRPFLRWTLVGPCTPYRAM